VRASLPPPPAREGGMCKPNNVKKNFVNVLESEKETCSSSRAENVKWRL